IDDYLIWNKEVKVWEKAEKTGNNMEWSFQEPEEGLEINNYGLGIDADSGKIEFLKKWNE
ncbi:MAG: hypothetical protein JW995_10675, partial [Melioribacteraceae bacterium]|nr:hypothetical protein [Melioribacteraceae bacterium]